MSATNTEDTIAIERPPDTSSVESESRPDTGPDAITDRPDNDDAETLTLPLGNHPLRRKPVLF